MKFVRTMPLVALLVCGLATHGYVHAGNEDIREDIDHEEYLAGLSRREDALQQSVDDLAAARSALVATRAALAAAEVDFQEAMTAFTAVELSADPDALSAAWESVVSTWTSWKSLAETHDRQRSELETAENYWEVRSIFVGKYKNDYEAQSDPFAVRDRIARCASADCSAMDFLNDERLEVFQPHVLEMIGAHHAYAKGLTGKGVRIGIEDDIVNYRLPEFTGRISFDGARLT